MKTLLTIILLLTAQTVNAQFADKQIEAYASEVFEIVQGYIEGDSEYQGNHIMYGYANEHFDFSLVRTMIGMITSTNPNVALYRSWQKADDYYNYAVIINNKFVLVSYRPSDNLLLVGTEL